MSVALILGADGYIGFPLSMHLANRGWDVIAVDNFARRKWVTECGGQSALPIKSMPQRLQAYSAAFNRKIYFEYGDLRNYGFVYHIINKYKPDAIVHLGEQASAPFSMMDIDHAVLTQTNNLVSTLNVLYSMYQLVPDCHLVKMGSMGEYGIMNIDIPEGFFEVEYRGRTTTLPFPREAFPDWYHWSKVYDSGNIQMACQIWGLRSSDIMQGVVYGTRTDEIANDDLLTRFDFDAVFGTALNRFCAQAVVGHNLTVYGAGGQKRPFIALRDTINCLEMVMRNPPLRGEYRVCNQFDEVYTIAEVAQKVKAVGDNQLLNVNIDFIENPRVEDENEHYYHPINEKLRRMGFQAKHKMSDELEIMLADLRKYRSRLEAKAECIMPKVQWKGNGNKSHVPLALPSEQWVPDSINKL